MSKKDVGCESGGCLVVGRNMMEMERILECGLDGGWWRGLAGEDVGL